MVKANKSTIFYIVRHGQAEFNLKHIIGGTLEPNHLTEKGEEQAYKLSEELKQVKIDKIYSSDLMRAKKTAEVIASSKNLPVEIDALLRERSWGSLQGKTFEDAKREYSEAFVKETKIQGEEALNFKYVEDMESPKDTISRFERFLKKIARNHSGKRYS